MATELASGDNRPTNQQLEVQKLLEERLGATRGQVDGLVAKDLATFNDILKRQNITNIVVYHFTNAARPPSVNI